MKILCTIATIITLAASISSCEKLFQKESAADGKKTKKIAGLVFQEDQFFRLVLFGMRKKAEAAGVEFFEANSYNKPDREVQLINTYIAKKVDAIVISPLSKTASKTALKKAQEKGIKIITYNSTVDGNVASAYVESSQKDLGAQSGQAARRYIEEKLGGKAKIAMLAFKSQVPEQSNERSSGFKDEVTKLPGVTIVSEQDAWMPEMAIKKAGDILTANPDLNMIWAANEGGTVGSVMAVKNAGLSKKVAVFGTDTSKQLIQFLLNGDEILHGITGQLPYEIGEKAMEVAIAAVNGTPFDALTSIPGKLLERSKPEDAKAFLQRMKEQQSH